jgi:tetratricopeptide (TPR) repeat protein
MSKKPKRTKLTRPLKQLQQRPSASYQIQARLVDRIQYAERQLRGGDFAGCISTCEPLLNSLPKHSEMRLDVLGLIGLAHGMSQNYHESYDIFSEAISLDPTRAEFWHNHGLACYNLGRLAETVRDFERAVELTKNDTNEMARKFASQLRESRQELRTAMRAHGANTTLEQYTEREERFAQAVRLTKQEKWSEAELILRQLTETGARVAAYWGNLGVCLMAQFRYDEAEAALKKSLAIDPDYPFARDNLKSLPTLRRSKEPIKVKTINLAKGDDVKQSLALYDKNEEGEITSSTIIEKVGRATTGIWKPTGKQSPRYDFFLNTFLDTRFTTCPQCKGKTQARKFPLVINVNPKLPIILDKTCRYCDTCDLLIVHQNQLEEQLAKNLMTIDPDVVGNNYLVIGTLDRTEWDQLKHKDLSFGQIIEHLHDFKEVVTFSRRPVKK